MKRCIQKLEIILRVGVKKTSKEAALHDSAPERHFSPRTFFREGSVKEIIKTSIATKMFKT